MSIIQAIINFFQGLFKSNSSTKEEWSKINETPQAQSQKKYTPTEYKYKKRYLLTKHEYYFYKELKPIAYKLGFAVLAKIRMADLVTPDYPEHYRQYNGAFQKIKAKHIDFAFADPTNCAVILLIELDDSTHAEEDRRERDDFIDAVYLSCGYKILHVYTTENLEKQITDILYPEGVGASV